MSAARRRRSRPNDAALRHAGTLVLAAATAAALFLVASLFWEGGRAKAVGVSANRIGNPFNGVAADGGDTSYGKPAYARNVWSMKLDGTRIYFGHGNSSNFVFFMEGEAGPSGTTNAGPIALWYYDTTAGKFAVDSVGGTSASFTLSAANGGGTVGEANDEQIDTFRLANSDGTNTVLHFAGHAPHDTFAGVRLYRRDSNTTWTKYDSSTPSSGVGRTYDVFNSSLVVNRPFAGLGNINPGFNWVASPSSTGSTSSWTGVTSATTVGRRAFTFFTTSTETYASVEGAQVGSWVSKWDGTNFTPLSGAGCNNDAEAF